MTFFVAAIGAGAGVLAAPVGSALLYGAVGAGIGGTIGSSMSASKAAKSASQMQANAA